MTRAAFEQHEFAVAGDQEVEHLGVAVAGLEPLAHQHPQVVRQRRVGIVDRLVLADHAAQFLGQRAGTGFQDRVRQHLLGLDRPQRRHRREQQDERHGEYRRQQEAQARGGHGAHSAACSAAGAFARRGAPTRSRRSDSDSAPPANMNRAPSQISSTCGLK